MGMIPTLIAQTASIPTPRRWPTDGPKFVDVGPTLIQMFVWGRVRGGTRQVWTDDVFLVDQSGKSA